jgi:hypothetical protein
VLRLKEHMVSRVLKSRIKEAGGAAGAGTLQQAAFEQVILPLSGAATASANHALPYWKAAFEQVILPLSSAATL